MVRFLLSGRSLEKKKEESIYTHTHLYCMCKPDRTQMTHWRQRASLHGRIKHQSVDFYHELTQPRLILSSSLSALNGEQGGGEGAA